MIRDRLGRIWRWPLHSRSRAVATLLALTVLVLLWPKIGGHHTTAAVDTSGPPGVESPTMSGQTAPRAPSSEGKTTATIQPTGHSAAVSPVGTPAVTPTPEAAGGHSAHSSMIAIGPTGGPAVLVRVPAPPVLSAARGDYTTPERVAAKYLQVWCYQPATRAANTDIANSASWVTAAGWADDKTRAVSQESWSRTQQAGLTSVCGPVTVTVLREAPNTDGLQWVGLAARQAFVSSAGVIVGQQTISQTRRILRAPDGRWLVDVQAQAG